MYAGGVRKVPVLANDSDPDGDELEICRVGAVDRGLRVYEPRPWYEEDESFSLDEVEGDLTVRVARGMAAGGLEATYYACDTTTLSPATLRVRVPRPRPVSVKPVAGKPGRFVVRNTQSFPLDVYYSWREPNSETTAGRSLRAGRRFTFAIPVERGTWFAVNVRRGYRDQGRLR